MLHELGARSHKAKTDLSTAVEYPTPAYKVNRFHSGLSHGKNRAPPLNWPRRGLTNF